MCACVLGEGWSGVKVRKKRRQQQTKEKVKKRGWGLAGNNFFVSTSPFHFERFTFTISHSE